MIIKASATLRNNYSSISELAKKQTNLFISLKTVMEIS